MREIEEFLNYIKLKNYSGYTVSSYEDDLIEVYKYFNKNISSLSIADIKKYLSKLYSRNLNSSSISRKISTLKSFYKFQNKKGNKNNPILYISYPKKEKKLPKFLYYNEILEVIKESEKTHFNQRDMLIIEMFYATGVRISELVHIKLKDIDFNDCKIRVLGKGSKERMVFYGEYVSQLLDKYINDERKRLLNNKESDYLFINKNGTGISERGVRLIVNNIIKHLSIKTKISPHTIRHTFATHMLNEGCDIRVVQELLGHKNLNTTEIYTHITNDQLREVYFKSHPRS